MPPGARCSPTCGSASSRAAGWPLCTTNDSPPAAAAATSSTRATYVDTSSYGRQGIDALTRVLGIDVIVLGSDRPYAEPADAQLGDAARHAISVTNPRRLTGRRRHMSAPAYVAEQTAGVPARAAARLIDLATDVELRGPAGP